MNKKRQMACKPGSVPAHGGRWLFLCDVRRRTPRATHPDGGRKQPLPSLFGLAPGGACRAIFVAEDAVRSYRTISTLPGHRCTVGGLLSVALSLESPPPDVIRHHVSAEPGLSSRAASRRAAIRPSDMRDNWITEQECQSRAAARREWLCIPNPHARLCARVENGAETPR